jgi:amphi-Trp domain-containing protein
VIVSEWSASRATDYAASDVGVLAERAARCRVAHGRSGGVTLRPMASRDVERNCTTESFVITLRRLADALEAGEPVRIPVLGKRFTVPAGAELSIEHEAEGDEEELELQLKWRNA